ncbi:MAG: peptide ABC transporter substrate-binding protein [Phycisphaerales bacterium]|nr:MAG: peptide ABC transporter substrate-binding protein [Phycisphaerales bacterium]
MFRTVIVVCVVLLAAILASYRLAEEGPQADFRYANATGISTLDPARISHSHDIRIAINIWEGLTTYHPKTTEAVEGVARFPVDVSADGCVYTFDLRADARWSNGDPVTATDFIRGWRRVIEPGTAGDYAMFIVDRVAGAREYYAWRNQAVAVLTALHRLADGWPIDAESARALYDHAGDAFVRDVYDGLEPTEPANRSVRPARSPAGHAQDADDRWQRLADGLASSDHDWRAAHEGFFRLHAARRDARFAAVGLQALSRHRLRVTLARPCPYFLDLCAFATLVPCHASIERLREQVDATGLTSEGLVVYDPQWTKPDYRRNGYPGLITNGPYRLKVWAFKRRIRLEANPHFWGLDRLRCRTIDMVEFADLNTSIMAYEAGDVDFLIDMQVEYDHELIRMARSGARPDLHVPVAFGMYFLLFNCQSPTVKGRPNPFVDARVRKAFVSAVDKYAIVNNVLQRGDPVTGNVVPVGSIPAYPSPPGLGCDPAQARRWLTEAGYPNGEGFPPVEVLYNTDSQHEKISQVLGRTWEQELGVRVELRGKEFRTFGDDKVNRNYMIARAGWWGDYRDPTTFLELFATGNGNNDSGYSNPRFDALLDRAAGEADRARRLALLAEAEAIIVQEDLPLLPLFQHTNLMAIKPYVRGVYPNPAVTFPMRYWGIER